MELARDEARDWRPVSEGVTLAPLRMADGAGTFLMRFEPGSQCPAHSQPGGEEIYVVEGEGRLDDLAFTAGDFIYTPPGEAHVLYARSRVVIHVTLPEAVVLLD